MAASSAKSDEGFPYWLLAAALLGLYFAWEIHQSDLYAAAFATVSKGVWITLQVTFIAFALSCALGMVLAVAGKSKWRVVREAVRFYIEIVRGIPMLVLLFYIAFVGAPQIVALYNWLLSPLIEADVIDPLRTRDLSMMWRAIIALTIGYSAYIAEIFRAGIDAVSKGQVEAAQSLGLSRWQTFRLLVMPQALQTVLPPLGNDFIAMVKDSALVSVLGVADVTQLGKTYAAGSFLFMETYNVVTYIYLVMTITLSLGLRRLERRMKNKKG